MYYQYWIITVGNCVAIRVTIESVGNWDNDVLKTASRTPATNKTVQTANGLFKHPSWIHVVHYCIM